LTYRVREGSYLEAAYFLWVEVVLFLFEELIAEGVQVLILFEIYLDFVHVLAGFLQELVDDRNGRGLEAQTELYRVCGDEASGTGWYLVL
jgi:hypothetical protein